MPYDIVEYIDECEGLHPSRIKRGVRLMLPEHLDVVDGDLSKWDLSRFTSFQHVHLDFSRVISISSAWFCWYVGIRLSTDREDQWIIPRNVNKELREAMSLFCG